FHLRGGMDYSRLTFVHRSMMSMLRKMLLKKEDSERSWEDRQILETYGQCLDFTDRESIRPLVEYTGCESSL
ncbi:MAG: flavodoxin domain-containing protein, partial [Schaedlerella sp.]